MAKNYDWVTDEMFREKLEQLVNETYASELISIPGVYEHLADHFNNDVLSELEAERDSDEEDLDCD